MSPLGTAGAAETYIQPQLDLRLETNTNFDLEPGGGDDSNVYGYLADLSARIGMSTPRSDTTLRPRIILQDYPDREDVDRFEAFLDLRSSYRWEASDMFVRARYSRQDLYNAELPKEVFDPFDPLDPNFGSDAEAGRVVVGTVRQRVLVDPRYTYELSQRLRIGGTASLGATRYDTDSRVDYDNWQVGAFTSWSLDPRTDIGADVYTSRFEATDDTSHTDAVGIGASLVHRYSDTAGIEGRLFFESNDVTEFVPVRSEDTSTGWGGNLTAYINGQVTQWRFTAEQGYWPSGLGGKQQTTQLRAEYGRALSERLRFDGNARYLRERSLGAADDEDDRDYARLQLALRYKMTPTWYVSGGYAYVWQEYVNDTDDADNNQVFLSVGYVGLGRQRR